MLTMTRLASYQAIHRRNFSKESGSCPVRLLNMPYAEPGALASKRSRFYQTAVFCLIFY